MLSYSALVQYSLLHAGHVYGRALYRYGSSAVFSVPASCKVPGVATDGRERWVCRLLPQMLLHIWSQQPRDPVIYSALQPFLTNNR